MQSFSLFSHYFRDICSKGNNNITITQFSFLYGWKMYNREKRWWWRDAVHHSFSTLIYSTKYVRVGYIYSQINGVLWRVQYNMMTTLFVQIAEARQISFRMYGLYVCSMVANIMETSRITLNNKIENNNIYGDSGGC